MEVRTPVSNQQARTLAAAGIGGVLLLWCAVSYGGLISTIILPSPTDVLAAFPVLHFEEALVRSALASLYRVGMGFLLSGLVAIPLGLLMGTFPAVKHVIAPLVVHLASPGCSLTGQVFGARQNEIYLYSQPRQVRSVHREAGWSARSIHEHAIPSMRQFLTGPEDSSQAIGWDPI